MISFARYHAPRSACSPRSSGHRLGHRLDTGWIPAGDRLTALGTGHDSNRTATAPAAELPSATCCWPEPVPASWYLLAALRQSLTPAVADKQVVWAMQLSSPSYHSSQPAMSILSHGMEALVPCINGGLFAHQHATVRPVKIEEDFGREVVSCPAESFALGATQGAVGGWPGQSVWGPVDQPMFRGGETASPDAILAAR